jgi:hypothetical protein
VQQVNQAMDAFIGTTTGGMSTLMQFNAAIRAMGKDTASTSQSITGQISSISSTAQKMGFTLQGIGPHAQQSWQQFDSAVQQANSVLDTMRTGMAENVVSSGQYMTAIKDAGGALLPFAAHNKTALSMVSQLAQEMGVPATHNMKTLAQEFGITGRAAQNQLAAGVERAIGRMSNLNVVARNLSVTVGQQLDTAMATAITKFSGVAGAAAAYARGLANAHTPASTLAKLQTNFNTALATENRMTQTATTDINKHATALKGLGSATHAAASDVGNLGDAVKHTHTALIEQANNAKTAALNARDFGQQSQTAAGQNDHLRTAAQQAAAQVKTLGSDSATTRGQLGDVNNEIRTQTGLAGTAAGKMATLAGQIATVGAQAATAAGEVHGLASAISSLTSKTITITTNFVSTHSARAAGGPVAAGIPYTVGEMGRELFVPDTSGFIVPHGQTEQFLSSPRGHSAAFPAAAGGGGGGNMQATIHNHVFLDGQQVWNSVRTETLRWNTRNGNPQSGAMGRAVAPGA